MGTLYETILALCTEAGIKPGKMCTETGISRGLITDLKSGRKKTVTAPTAQKIADYFGVSVDRVLGNEDNEKSPAPEGVELSPNQQELFEIIKAGDADTIKVLLDFAHLIKKNRSAE